MNLITDMTDMSEKVIAFRSSGKKHDDYIEECNIINNPLYIRRMACLVREALQKGSDVLHLSNGNIIVTETKIITYHYVWNADKGRFERAKSGSKSTVRTSKRKADVIFGE